MITIINESIEYHDSLNPKLWDENNNLRPEVRDTITKIIDQFTKSMDFPISIVDTYILGSNASYNYNDSSDLDVHLVVNYNLIDADKDVVQALYNALKTNFNKDYDFKIHGINVELYVQDVNSSTVSNGIYSLNRDSWIRFPEHLSDTKSEIEDQELFNSLRDRAYEILDSNSSSEVENFINELYLIRQQSLMTDGEYGDGNLIFKELRSDGILDGLKDRYKMLVSNELSIESIDRDRNFIKSCEHPIMGMLDELR